MPTLRTICSDIQSQLKANNIDDRLSFRFLASRVKDKIKSFVKQDADNRRFDKYSYLWVTFPNVEMKEVPNVDASIAVPHCKTLRKSKIKLPKTISTNYGDLVRIFTIDGQKEYHLTSKINYQDIQKREFRDNRIKYAWIENEFLFIPDSEVDIVKAMGLPEDSLSKDKCSKPLDEEVTMPSYLLDVVKKDILNDLMGTTKRITEDAKPDLNPQTKA